MDTNAQKFQRASSHALRRVVALMLATTAVARGAQLPIPCLAGTCKNPAAAPVGWSTSLDGKTLNPGAASFVQSGNQLTITQKQPSAYLNWQSFNISADGTVTFVQPSSSAVALNRIYQADATRIFGALQSNGTVYLLNQNGFLFGAGSSVNVGGLLATSLDLSDAAKQRGIAGASTPLNGTPGAALPGPALQPYVDANGNDIQNIGSVEVSPGASITSNQGQVLLFAPRVENTGTISTPNGQTILGAGQRIYLAVSGGTSGSGDRSDPAVRGLLIEVGGGGTVTNAVDPATGSIGQIMANAGNVTLAGLAVNQNGRISATTTVRSNGSIRLQAQDTDATFLPGGQTIEQTANRSGTVTLGPSSSTSVTLEGGPADKTVDVNAQPKSEIKILGGQIEILDHASVSAPGGNVAATALADPQAISQGRLTNGSSPPQPEDSRIYLAPSSAIDVSGTDVSLPVSDNSLAVQLRGSQLADFPQQRNGPLRGQTVYVDIRQHGTRSDGSTWVGTPLADLSGDVSTIQRDVFERNLTGGTISLTAGGTAIISPGASLNVSGGQIAWQGGYVKSSVLVGANGKLYPIGKANPQQTFFGTLDSISQNDPHWGSVSTVTMPGRDPRGVYQPGYVEGKDAGTVSILTPALILDGTVCAGATRGPLQRQPTDLKFPQNQGLYYPGQQYRFSDQVPLGGSLIIGNAGALDLTQLPHQREVFENLTFASGAVLPTLSGPGGRPFDPEHDPLPNGFVSTLQPTILGGSSVSRLSVYAEGSITVQQGTVLSPGAGGAITFAAGDVEFAGSIQSSGGSVTLEATPTILRGGTAAGGQTGNPATQLFLAPGSSIDTRGAWVNDSTLFTSAQSAPLFLSGGNVQFLAPAGGSLILSKGASIDVSGGAQRTTTGQLVAGTGGKVTVSALPPVLQGENPTYVQEAASLSGYALNDGGTLSLSLPNVCLSSLTCSDPTAFRVDPGLLTDFGFASISLSAAPGVAAKAVPDQGAGGLVVASDVNVYDRQRNLEFLPGAFSHPSAASLGGLTQVTTLPEFLRHPVSLGLAANAPVTDSPQFADLRVADGASLTFDPGARVTLATNSRVFMDGALRAPAGTVSVAVSGNLTNGNRQVLGDQAIWMGPASVIDVSGVVQAQPSDTGLTIGTVLSGGTVSLSASSGYLIGLPGSQILAGGTSAVLDLRSPGGGTYSAQTIASAGGSISLFAAEGIEYSGGLAAPSGAPGEVPGGSISVALDGNAPRVGFPFLLNNPRLLAITAGSSPTVIGEGAAVPDFLNGVGRISAALLENGGFDNVTLKANDLRTFNPSDTTHPGLVQSAVVFDPGVSLSPAESLSIDTPEIRTTGPGRVSLASAYVALGSTDSMVQQVDTAAVAGLGSLTVSGKLIDLVGTLDLGGFGTTQLVSSGDIRAVGVQLSLSSPFAANQPGNGFNGVLSTPGNLTLTAQQIYPTTLTNYAVQLANADPTQSVLTIDKASGTPPEVLSAAGNLTLSANQIQDSGVLRAPIGTIALQGQTVNLQEGAIVSVSADGTTIPFGQTQGGFDWVYQLRPNGGTNGGAVYSVYGSGSGDIQPPRKQVQIAADSFTFNKGARIDISGGGDLSAYEWTPGLGGSKDVLATSASPGTYAVIPGLNLPFAPIDPTEDRGFTQPVGSSVYLSGGAGLPAGTYALLPARYALLPGAFLVKPVSGYTDLAAGQSISQMDGSVIISGYGVNAGTGLRASRTSGFDVISGKYAFSEAQYSVTSANSFFATQAASAGVTTPRLPVDAGALAINASRSATLLGALVGTAAAGGRGGTVDFTAANLFVTNNVSNAPSGSVGLDVNQLNQLGATSLLLGATRIDAGGYTELVIPEPDVQKGTQGNVVEIDSAAVLSAPEIILAASQAVKLDAGAVMNATGSAPGAEPDLLAPIGTAVLRASTGGQVALNPPLPAGSPVPAPISGGSGSITVAAGASLSASGSVSVDASAVEFAGTLSAKGAAVRLGGPQLALGAAQPGFQGFLIGPGLITGLANADLTLQVTNPSDPQYASRPIQVFGPVNLSLSALTVDAPGLVAGTADAQLNVTAQNITLESGSQQLYTPALASGGSGSVSLSAQHVGLAGGTFTESGFSSTTLNASKDLTSVADGTLGVSGSLALNSPILQSAAGATFNFFAGTDLTTGLAGSAAAAPTAVAGPGGALSFSAANVTLGGNIVLPGGRIQATASSGALEVLTGTTLDVSGFERNFDGAIRSAGGGTIQLVSATQNVGVASGSVLDVSAGSGAGNGGLLALTAPQGTVAVAGQVRGAGAAGAAGADLSVEAQSLDFAGLVGLAGTAGFSGSVKLHERGVGDFTLAPGTTLHASDVQLTADQGHILVQGTVDAGNDLGGTIILTGNSIELAGTLTAGSTGRPDRGGTVELLSTGSLFLDGGSNISVGGAGGSAAASSVGKVWLRAPQDVVTSVLPGSGPQLIRLDGAVTGAGNVYLEAYNHTPYSPTTPGSITSQDVGSAADPTTSPWYNNAAAFMSNQAPAVLAALAASKGLASKSNFALLPGVEIDAPGDLHLATPWDFHAWRFGAGTVPGVLTIRAGGSLYVDNSISDGFLGLDPGFGFNLDVTPSRSWSYRLVAGANTNSSNPLAAYTTTELSGLDAGQGSLIVAAGQPSVAGLPSSPVVIRTGTGSIDIAAAGDLRLGNQASVIYTAGTVAPFGRYYTGSQDQAFQALGYPVGGGNLSINVGRDIDGATSNQLFNSWLWSIGAAAPPSNPNLFQPTAWAPNYGTFEQGIGALGGGDLTIHAGGNIADLGANVPSTGIPIGDGSPQGTATTEVNNGVLTVTAGGNINGGKFLDMAGQAYITAGGVLQIGHPQSAIAAGVPDAGLYAVLATGSGQFQVTARGSLTIDSIVDPTLLLRSSLQNSGLNVFATYTDASRVDLVSVGGDVADANRAVTLQNTSANLQYSFGIDTPFRVLPPTLDAVALGGDVVLAGNLDLWPSAHGNLDLLAAGSVRLNGSSIIVSDADPTTLPTPAQVALLTGLAVLDPPSAGTIGPGGVVSQAAPGFHATQPVHGGGFASDGQPDLVPVRLVALTGDVTQPNSGSNYFIDVPKPIDIVAGRDIVNLSLNVQQFTDGSVSSITAGRDMTYPSGRGPSGSLLPNGDAINVAGPGHLDIQAGRNANLGTSNGITSWGNFFNAALPTTGASLSVSAGIDAPPQYQTFIDTYLAKSSLYDDVLEKFVALESGLENLSKAQTLALFEALPTGLQAPLIQQVFFDELRAGGRSAAAAGPGHDDFTRAFTALTTLFPGANPNLAKGETVPYQGDLSLFFSRIYTLAGGDINLLAPGGQINVGLAAAPAAFGVTKRPEQLGMVAQGPGSVSMLAYGDVQVNQSRVFAADGGNILMWSTEGNIDAGRGAKTAISAPPPTITIDPSTGQATLQYPPALTGSGIQTLASTAGVSPGDVDLFAPHGVVNANDAGIVAGNLTIAATAVLGASNITVSGTSVGVPVEVTGLGASLASASSSGSAATTTAQSSLGESNGGAKQAPQAEAALGWLDVFVLGLGEEQCRPEDVECIKRQQH